MTSTIPFERRGAAAARRVHNPEVARASRAVASILLVAALGACTIQVRHEPVLLPLPARPVLTPIKASDLQCLSDSAYTTVVNRERGYKTWGLQLEAILRANNAKANGSK